MKLGKNQRCPIHHRLTCCGREAIAAKPRRKDYTIIGPGVKLLSDGRVRRTPAAMKRLLEKKIHTQDGHCYWCGVAFDDFRGVEPDHIEPRGMGGARRDDSEPNIVAACAGCNREKGSRRDFVVKSKSLERSPVKVHPRGNTGGPTTARTYTADSSDGKEVASEQLDGKNGTRLQ